jgi:hypothetical protein
VSPDTVTGLSLPDGYRLFTRVSFFSADPLDPFTDALQHPETDFLLSHWQRADFTWQIYNTDDFTPYDISGTITDSRVSILGTSLVPEPSTSLIAGLSLLTWLGCAWHRGRREGTLLSRRTEWRMSIQWHVLWTGHGPASS